MNRAKYHRRDITYSGKTLQVQSPSIAPRQAAMALTSRRLILLVVRTVKLSLSPSPTTSLAGYVGGRIMPSTPTKRRSGPKRGAKPGVKRAKRAPKTVVCIDSYVLSDYDLCLRLLTSTSPPLVRTPNGLTFARTIPPHLAR